MAETKTDAARAEDEARKKEQTAAEARAKAGEADKSAEAKKAEKAAQDADDARAQAAQARSAEAGKTEPDTAETARVVGAPDPGMSAGDHFAQKFGNDPANPQPAPGLSGEPSVRLTRHTPDKPDGPVETFVHEAMVGDYLRAGWSRAA